MSRVVLRPATYLRGIEIIDTRVVECLQLICCPIDICASVTTTTSSV
mgnify:CR=1 FL=1